MRGARMASAVAMLGILGSLLTGIALYQGAKAALDVALEARLRGAGETAALLLSDLESSSAQLKSLMTANALDGAYLVSPSLVVLGDATGPSGQRVDLLRVDVPRVRAAFAGEGSVAPAYSLGELSVASGYFPIRSRQGEIQAVLALEAGQAFAEAHAKLNRALYFSGALALVGGLALGILTASWSRSFRREKEAAARAARGDTLAKMAAMAAHEIRNPLGIIRGSVELMKERLGKNWDERSQSAADDVLSEVDRLRQLTEDFLDLSHDRPMALEQVELADLLAGCARGLTSRFPRSVVRLPEGALPQVAGDPGRLNQVLSNLFSNAVLAGASTIEVRSRTEGSQLVLQVRDDGPGIPLSLRPKLFEPFVSGRADGTGLGLSLSRRIAERHGGTLELLKEMPGAVFELRLPTADRKEH